MSNNNPSVASHEVDEHPVDALACEYFARQYIMEHSGHTPIDPADLAAVVAVGNAVREGKISESDIPHALQDYRNRNAQDGKNPV